MKPEDKKLEDLGELEKLNQGLQIDETKKTDVTSSVDRDEMNREILKVKDSVTANFVTILGIFASFLAFLIIEIQILKTVCDYLRILGLSMFILGAILCFITFLLYFVDSQNKKTSQMVILSIIAGGLIIVGTILVGNSSNEYVCNMTKMNEEFSKFQNNLQTDQENWYKQKSVELKKIEDMMIRKINEN